MASSFALLNSRSRQRLASGVVAKSMREYKVIAYRSSRADVPSLHFFKSHKISRGMIVKTVLMAPINCLDFYQRHHRLDVPLPSPQMLYTRFCSRCARGWKVIISGYTYPWFLRKVNTYFHKFNLLLQCCVNSPLMDSLPRDQSVFALLYIYLGVFPSGLLDY